MICPECRKGCAADDMYCRRCGADLNAPSKKLVVIQPQLPAVLHNPRLPRVAAGVGAVALGVGLELLRRTFLSQIARPAARRSTKLLPALLSNNPTELLSSDKGRKSRTVKVPRGYEVQETVVYMSRVIRRKS